MAAELATSGSALGHRGDGVPVRHARGNIMIKDKTSFDRSARQESPYMHIINETRLRLSAQSIPCAYTLLALQKYTSTY